MNSEGRLKMYSFELKNDLSELETLRQNLENYAQCIGLCGKCIFEINLGLEELITNIISYGFKDNLEHLIKIKIRRNNKTLILYVEDDGLPFNPLEVKKPEHPCDIENIKIGGLGIHIIKTLMDDVFYERCEYKNKLTLKKKIETN